MSKSDFEKIITIAIDEETQVIIHKKKADYQKLGIKANLSEIVRNLLKKGWTYEQENK